MNPPLSIFALAAACDAVVVALPDSTAAVACGYTSDLLSDVMAHAPSGAALVTIQNHRNTVAVATLVGIRAILICHDRPVPAEMIAAAVAERIALLRTPLGQFQATCRLSAALSTAGGR